MQPRSCTSNSYFRETKIQARLLDLTQIVNVLKVISIQVNMFKMNPTNKNKARFFENKKAFRNVKHKAKSVYI